MAAKREKTKVAGVYQLASLTRRHDGKSDVCYYYTFKNLEGKKVWVKAGWRSEGYSIQVAAGMRAKAIQCLRDGQELPNKRTGKCHIFSECWAIFDEKWLSTTIKHPDDERGRFERYIKPAFGHRRMDAITLMELEDFKNILLAKPLSPASVRLIVGDIRRVYRKMIEWDIYKGNDPTVKLAMPKVENARTRFLTPQEAQSLLQEILRRSKTWHNIAMLSLHTGMRLSEVLNVQFQDINLFAKTIRVRDGKTGSRTVHMTEMVHAILCEHLPAGASTLVFTGKNGRQLIATDTSNTFAKSVEACGLNPEGTDRRNRVCFHTLRHTYCSWLAMSGTPLYVIGEMVGHSSTEMTKRYSHLCPSSAKNTTVHIENMLKF